MPNQLGQLLSGVLELQNANLQRRIRQAKGLPTGNREALSEELLKRKLQELQQPAPSVAERAAELQALGAAQNAVADGTSQVSANHLQRLLPARGEVLNQNTQRDLSLLNANTSSEERLLPARADQALRMVNPLIDQERWLAGESQADARDKFMAYAQGENAATRALQEKFLAQRNTQWLISSLLGAGLGAAALLG